jgi:hypothetical protein
MVFRTALAKKRRCFSTPFACVRQPACRESSSCASDRTEEANIHGSLEPRLKNDVERRFRCSLHGFESARGDHLAQLFLPGLCAKSRAEASLVRFRCGLPGCLPPCTDRTGTPQPSGTFTSRLSTDRSPSPSLDMTTTVTGLLLAGLSPAGMAASLAARSFETKPEALSLPSVGQILLIS